MKILIVCSGTKRDFKFERDRPFVYEQIDAIRKYFFVDFDLFFIKEKGFKGYIKSIYRLMRHLRHFRYDLIHAHYGYSGFVSIFQRSVPTIVTYHGTDINHLGNNIISSIVIMLASWNIFVSEKLKKKSIMNSKKCSIIPCGINISEFFLMEKKDARIQLELDLNKKYILFSSSFKKKVKNYPLAKKAISLLNEEVELIELDGYNRAEVNYLLNACDVVLMTSYSEGSPQIIKEAMACNVPIVATDVGEVRNIINRTNGCWITNFNPDNIANMLQLALEFKHKTIGRAKIRNYDNQIIAEKVFSIYNKVLKEKRDS